MDAWGWEERTEMKQMHQLARAADDLWGVEMKGGVKKKNPKALKMLSSHLRLTENIWLLEGTLI